MANEEKKVIAIITARSGSKGLPDKNIKLLHGKPLIAYSIEAAIDSGCFDKVFVSTDSQKYADISKQYGADVSFLRSKEMSSDSAGSWDVVREVVKEFEKRGEEYGKVMLLQPTSPLRSSADIQNSFAFMDKMNANSVVGVTETDHSPLWCNTLPEDLSMENFRRSEYDDLPRQMLPKYYRINGAIYLIRIEELEEENMFRKKSFAYIMPRERSVDIDSELDFIIAEQLMKSVVNV
ncbi:MAG TPA: CMP-N-acetlyneuraminic acid synthetase [Eubacterium sp.]|nr:CMP-N-acetlyneuraminic acid synthetase [Eubacterium sp.]